MTRAEFLKLSPQEKITYLAKEEDKKLNSVSVVKHQPLRKPTPCKEGKREPYKTQEERVQEQLDEEFRLFGNPLD